MVTERPKKHSSVADAETDALLDTTCHTLCGEKPVTARVQERICPIRLLWDLGKSELRRNSPQPSRGVEQSSKLKWRPVGAFDGEWRD